MHPWHDALCNLRPPPPQQAAPALPLPLPLPIHQGIIVKPNRKFKPYGVSAIFYSGGINEIMVRSWSWGGKTGLLGAAEHACHARTRSNNITGLQGGAKIALLLCLLLRATCWCSEQRPAAPSHWWPASRFQS